MDYRYYTKRLKEVRRAMIAEVPGWYEGKIDKMLTMLPDNIKDPHLFISRDIWEMIGKPSTYKGIDVTKFNFDVEQVYLTKRAAFYWNDNFLN